MPLKYDISNENFDYYFLEQAANLREVQREMLPPDLLSKIYKKGYRINTTSSSKMDFAEKLFVLKVLGKRWVLIIEDEINGLSIEDFYKYQELSKKRKQANTEEIIEKGVFALVNSEVIEVNNVVNKRTVSAAYNYLMKIKTKNYLKPDEHKAGMNYLAKFLNNYESQRKKITLDTGINMAEWIVLTYLYDGEEKGCSILYKEKFKFSYNSSSTKIKVALGTLQFKGFIIKIGIKASAKFQITAMGRQKMNTLMSKYVLNS